MAGAAGTIAVGDEAGSRSCLITIPVVVQYCTEVNTQKEVSIHMAQVIYASFTDVELAKKAAGALLDKGIKAEQLSLVTRNPGYHRDEDQAASDTAKKGITTTTPGDAALGAVEGGVIGVGVGVLAAVASLLVPGFGIVVGGGALATAIAGALGATGAGAVSGGALGYLKDQGVDNEVAEKFDADLDAEGALVSVDMPSGDVTNADVEEVFGKYRGNVHRLF